MKTSTQLPTVLRNEASNPIADGDAVNLSTSYLKDKTVLKSLKTPGTDASMYQNKFLLFVPTLLETFS